MGAGGSNICSAIKPAISRGLVGLISLVQRYQSNQLFTGAGGSNISSADSSQTSYFTGAGGSNISS